MSSGSAGQPSHATPVATPSRARRTASLLRNMSVSRPHSAAPTATRRATVTFSGSSRPVGRLMTALLAIVLALLWLGRSDAGRRGPAVDLEQPHRPIRTARFYRCPLDDRDGGRRRRPGFPLQIERFEGIEQAVLEGEQRGCRAGGGAGLAVDAL